MNDFCKTCQHLEIPKILKNKFNKIHFPLFINHPLDEKNVVGCVVKYQNIDWSTFFEFLVNKNLLTKTEYEKLRNDGWTITDRK